MATAQRFRSRKCYWKCPHSEWVEQGIEAGEGGKGKRHTPDRRRKGGKPPTQPNSTLRDDTNAPREEKEYYGWHSSSRSPQWTEPHDYTHSRSWGQEDWTFGTRQAYASGTEEETQWIERGWKPPRDYLARGEGCGATSYTDVGLPYTETSGRADPQNQKQAATNTPDTQLKQIETRRRNRDRGSTEPRRRQIPTRPTPLRKGRNETRGTTPAAMPTPTLSKCSTTTASSHPLPTPNLLKKGTRNPMGKKARGSPPSLGTRIPGTKQPGLRYRRGRRRHR